MICKEEAGSFAPVAALAGEAPKSVPDSRCQVIVSGDEFSRRTSTCSGGIDNSQRGLVACPREDSSAQFGLPGVAGADLVRDTAGFL